MKLFKLDTTLTEAKDANEALNFIWIGFKYFLIRNTTKTIIAVLVVLIGLGMFFQGYIINYFNSLKDGVP